MVKIRELYEIILTFRTAPGKIKSIPTENPKLYPPPPHLSSPTPPHTTTMAKDKSEAEKRERKEAKKDKKRKAEDEGADDTPRKEKKSKRKSEGAVVVEDGAMDVDETSLVQVEGANSSSAAVMAIPLAALVPFANPLADDKSQKKVLKSVKKGASQSIPHQYAFNTN